MGTHSFAHRHLQNQQRGALRLDESDAQSDRNRSPAVPDRRTPPLVVRPHLVILRRCRLHTRRQRFANTLINRLQSPRQTFANGTRTSLTIIVSDNGTHVERHASLGAAEQHYLTFCRARQIHAERLLFDLPWQDGGRASERKPVLRPRSCPDKASAFGAWLSHFRQLMPPISPQHAIRPATLTSSADRVLLHPALDGVKFAEALTAAG